MRPIKRSFGLAKEGLALDCAVVDYSGATAPDLHRLLHFVVTKQCHPMLQYDRVSSFLRTKSQADSERIKAD
jgi:hypothetical protein